MPEGGLKMNKSGHLYCNFNYAFFQPKSLKEQRLSRKVVNFYNLIAMLYTT